MLSLIIPTLNAGAALAQGLAAMPQGLADEIVVSDGGSGDDTVAVAVQYNARIALGEAGRGRQLACGGAAAMGDWYLFLHADTRLGGGAAEAVRAFISDPANQGRAGVFRFRLDDSGWRPRLVEFGVTLRSRLLRLPYGDQGLLISKRLYNQVGGFKPIELMEDVDMARRLNRRITVLPADAITSAARYRRDGYARRVARNLLCLALYYLGRDPARIRKRYEA